MTDLYHINDLDEIYNQDIIRNVEGDLICPVCRKAYQTMDGVQKHMDKRDCYSYRDAFEDSPVEDLLVKIANTVYNRKTTKTGLRNKKKQYSDVAQFFVFCRKNRLDDVEAYAMFLKLSYDKRSPGHILSVGRKNKTLKKYRQFLNESPDELIDGESFYEQHKDRLHESFEFCVRSMERGELDYKTVRRHDLFDTRKLNTVERNRLKQATREYGVKL